MRSLYSLIFLNNALSVHKWAVAPEFKNHIFFGNLSSWVTEQKTEYDFGFALSLSCDFFFALHFEALWPLPPQFQHVTVLLPFAACLCSLCPFRLLTLFSFSFVDRILKTVSSDFSTWFYCTFRLCPSSCNLIFSILSDGNSSRVSRAITKPSNDWGKLDNSRTLRISSWTTKPTSFNFSTLS